MLFPGLHAPYWTLQVRIIVTWALCVFRHHIARRICIALRLCGQQVMFQTLHGLFEVAHVDEKLPERGLCYMKGSF